jgi:hypothetical protein
MTDLQCATKHVMTFSEDVHMAVYGQGQTINNVEEEYIKSP